MKTRSLPSATLSLFLSSVAVWLVGFSAGVMAHPTELALRYPDESESVVLPCLNLKNMSSFFTSILVLATLRNGCPRMSCTVRSPSIYMSTKLARTIESLTRTKIFFDYPFGISN